MLFDGNDFSVPPKNDELEVTLIGPGYGEALVLHVGDGQWILVDSCIVPGTDESAALLYLSDIGVKPEAVVRVIASHWDDDHIRGMSSVVRACTSAEFVMSQALLKDEFIG
jgi:glyoxylase-like metal-dependent hydrolase (beta-lactamase superfamily II)